MVYTSKDLFNCKHPVGTRVLYRLNDTPQGVWVHGWIRRVPSYVPRDIYTHGVVPRANAKEADYWSSITEWKPMKNPLEKPT